MRVLLTVQPGTGQLHPLVPLARALGDAGHEAAVCAAPSFRHEVEGFCLTHIDAGLDWLTSDQSTWRAFPPMPPPGPEFGQLLARCDLFITHGGFNSVKEALSEGVPMVVIPISADQPYSARRCAALGVARAIDPSDRSPDAIRTAARNVLADPSYRANARRFQTEMTALAGPEQIVKLLEALDHDIHDLAPTRRPVVEARA